VDKEKRSGILGMARSGLAVREAGLERGLDCRVFDDDPAKLESAIAKGGRAGRIEDVQGLDALVVSPGVPLHHPAPHKVILAASTQAVPLTSDMDLFAERLAGRRVIGITGTNGKSTTTALIHTSSSRPP
jgi:UDP-N-acetylmuramoylalanine--D-glutamate ligase